MARRRRRHDVDAVLSIEGMGISQNKSLPVIAKRKSVGRNIVYSRRSSHPKKRLARLNTGRKIKPRRIKTSSSRQKSIAAKKSQEDAAVATAVVNTDPPVAPAPNKKSITLHEKALWLLSQKAYPERSGEVVVRYSHYRAKFRVHNGVLKWQDIDEEYAISFVFKGNFGRHLCQESYQPPDSDGKKPPPIQVISDEPNLHFFVLVAPPEEPVAEFYLSLTEDPIAGVGVEGLRRAEPRFAAEPLQHFGGSRAVEEMTSRLRELSKRAGGLRTQEAQDLIARRDLEDVLYSGL